MRTELLIKSEYTVHADRIYISDERSTKDVVTKLRGYGMNIHAIVSAFDFIITKNDASAVVCIGPDNDIITELIDEG